MAAVLPLVDQHLAAVYAAAFGMSAGAVFFNPAAAVLSGMVTYNSLLQADVADHTRGRVFAGFDLLWQAGRLASVVLGGLVADMLGIQAVYVLGGVLLLLADSFGLASLSRPHRRRRNLSG